MHHTNRSSETGSVAPEQQLSFDTHPDRYRHWKLQFGGPVAQLCMNVDESGGQFSGYELKKNSYDIGVNIELYDAVQRLRFEHPEVRTVVLTSALPGMFCAGAEQIEYAYLKLEINRDLRVVILTVNGPGEYAPESLDDALGQGADFWPLAAARQLDHALLHLRFNEPELGTWVFKTEGDSAEVLSFDEFLGCHKENCRTGNHGNKKYLAG